MASPTKLNTGPNRPVTQINVLNADDRGVEREQLNRILKSFGERITVVEESSSSGGGVGGISAITSDASLYVNTSNGVANISVAVNGIQETNLAFNSVSTTKIQDRSVTYAKIQNVTSDRLLGRDTAGSGIVEEISLNSTLEFTGSGEIQRAALTGDVSAPAGSNTTTLATVNANVGSFGTSTQVGSFTVNAKGLITAASNTTISIPATAISDSTTVGRSFITTANPSAITFPRVNADNTVTYRAAADYRGDLGLGTAAVENIGTSGANVPLLNGNNTWSGTNGFQAVTATTLSTTGNVGIGDTTPSFRLDVNTGAAGEQAVAGFGTSAITGGLQVTTDGNLVWRLNALNSRSLVLQTNQTDRIAITGAGAVSVNGNTSITGTISASNLAGTTYTPTGTGVTNVTSVTPSLAIYDRLIGAASVNGKVSIVTTAAGPTTARLSLPVASNIGTTTDVSGVAIATDGTVATISGDATNDAALISFTAAAGTLYQFEVAYKYRII